MDPHCICQYPDSELPSKDYQEFELAKNRGFNLPQEQYPIRTIMSEFEQFSRQINQSGSEVLHHQEHYPRSRSPPSQPQFSKLADPNVQNHRPNNYSQESVQYPIQYLPSRNPFQDPGLHYPSTSRSAIPDARRHPGSRPPLMSRVPNPNEKYLASNLELEQSRGVPAHQSNQHFRGSSILPAPSYGLPNQGGPDQSPYLNSQRLGRHCTKEQYQRVSEPTLAVPYSISQSFGQPYPRQGLDSELSRPELLYPQETTHPQYQLYEPVPIKSPVFDGARTGLVHSENLLNPVPTSRIPFGNIPETGLVPSSLQTWSTNPEPLQRSLGPTQPGFDSLVYPRWPDTLPSTSNIPVAHDTSAEIRIVPPDCSKDLQPRPGPKKLRKDQFQDHVTPG